MLHLPFHLPLHLPTYRFRSGRRTPLLGRGTWKLTVKLLWHIMLELVQPLHKALFYLLASIVCFVLHLLLGGSFMNQAIECFHFLVSGRCILSECLSECAQTFDHSSWILSSSPLSTRCTAGSAILIGCTQEIPSCQSTFHEIYM